jgi:glycerophosphoryl diester phosphodiesterase
VSVWSSSGALVVGHRGGRATAPIGERATPPIDGQDGRTWAAENTMAAFEQARREGARAIELDVRTCGSGEVVVFHDETLSRMTGLRDERRVDVVDWASLARVDLGGGARVPRLREVLGWARGAGVAVNVELKHDVPSRIALAHAAAREVADAQADVLLSSFDPLLLAMASARASRVPRALLTYANQPRWADAVFRASRPPFIQAVHLERAQATAPVVGACARRGLRVGVWTVNDASEAREFVRGGVATVITDAPGRLLAAGVESAR